MAAIPYLLQNSHMCSFRVRGPIVNSCSRTYLSPFIVVAIALYAIIYHMLVYDILTQSLSEFFTHRKTGAFRRICIHPVWIKNTFHGAWRSTEDIGDGSHTEGTQI